MIIIVTGATHSGKTACAQKLMEILHIPYVSQDHIKMGLIRSGYSTLSPGAPDTIMTDYLWPITREMIKTAIENKQNLIVEGCYIPFDWKNDFSDEYIQAIQYICLSLSDSYIVGHYSEIMKYANYIEERMDDGYCTIELLKSENARFRKGCAENDLPFILIEKNYEQSIHDIMAAAPFWRDQSE